MAETGIEVHKNGLTVIPITRYLILDTNILSAFGDTGFGPQVVEYLENLIETSPGWGLAITDATLYESLNEIPFSEEEALSRHLDKIPSYPINRNTMLLAADLGNVYCDYFKETKSKENNEKEKMPEPMDKIISALVLQNNAFICTENIRDYPSPFFRESFKRIFSYEKKKGRGMRLKTIYITEPDVDAILKYHSKRTSGTREIGTMPKPDNIAKSKNKKPAYRTVKAIASKKEKRIP